MYKSQYK